MNKKIKRESVDPFFLSHQRKQEWEKIPNPQKNCIIGCEIIRPVLKKKKKLIKQSF